MNPTFIHTQSGLSELKLFFALSRTPHGLLDMATPALAALLWLGSFPPLRIVVLGLITAVAGYTAVYALNDLVDYHIDAKRIADRLLPDIQNDLDSIFIRHPLAYGLLSFPKGLLWTVAWASVALVGSYLLNPVCTGIFLGSILLEAIYCLMWKSSWLKVFISGAVKTSGAMAAVFAVDPQPALPSLILLFLWLFFLGDRRAECPQRLGRHRRGQDTPGNDHSRAVRPCGCQRGDIRFAAPGRDPGRDLHEPLTRRSPVRRRRSHPRCGHLSPPYPCVPAVPDKGADGGPGAL